MAAPARKSAAVRREEILVIALRHFAEGGYRGTSTEAIAREAGISQPYLFRLFRTKQELFLAVHDHAKAHLFEVWRRHAAAGPPETALQRMGMAYVEELVPDRHHILLMLQSYVACADPEICAHVRDRWADT